MAFSDTKIKEIEKIIDEHTQDTLDNYIRATIKKVASDTMKTNASAIEVADAVFDCINKNYSGDVYEAAVCKQICPKTVLYVLRSEIIKKLK